MVENIYDKAKKKDNAPQVIKALAHRVKFASYMEEDALIKSIVNLEDEVKTSKFPEQAIIHRLLSQMYWQY